MAKIAQKKRSGKSGGQDNKTAHRQTEEKKNSATQRKVMRSAYLQTKMAVSTPGDTQEQEADRVADEVSRMPKGVARAVDETAPPGSSQPENNAEQPQSLQTKISRFSEEPETVRTKLCRDNLEEANPKLMRSEEEDATAQAKLQRQEDEPTSTETDAEAASPETPIVADETEQKIESLRGQGNPMADDIRQEMEGKLHADFSRVSIHTSGDADALCKQLSARAFTVGNDIFFSAGEYAPTTEAGRKLLAHELTHVVQQQQGVSRKIYRTNGTEGPLPDSYSHRSYGDINTASSPKTIRIKGLQVPTFKNRFYQNASPDIVHDGLLTWRRNEKTGGKARDTNQINTWESDVRSDADDKVDSKLRRAYRTEQAGTYIYYFKYNSGRSYLFGTERTIKVRCRRPLWRRSGESASFQVDHQIEYQTGGADLIDNMWLLDGSINGKSGREIRAEIRSKVEAFVDHVKDEVNNPPTSVNDARENFVVYFDPIRPGLGSYDSVTAKQQYYTRDHIKDGDHLAALDPMSQAEISSSGLLSGNAENIDIFPSSYGGLRYRLQKDPGNDIYHLRGGGIHGVATQNFEIVSVNFNAQSKQGNINIRVPSQSVASTLPNSPAPVNIDPIPITPMDGIEWGGQFDRNALKRNVTQAITDFPGLSPLALDDVEINPGGIALTGIISPSLPLLENASVNFSLDGNSLNIWKTFEASEFNIPSPFRIDNTSLSLGISNQGMFVNGRINFGIDNLGDGHIGASAEANFDSSTSFSLTGEFNFDERLFGEGTTAQVRMGYANEQWSMGGTITIPEGKVPGVTSATIDVNYSEGDGFSARGDATLDIPGVESGTIEITQSEEAGFSIGGTFNLSPDAPGIRGGSISVTLSERPDGTGYALSATGEAQPDIPGINSNLIVSYNDGAFTAEIEADYSRGMLSGRVNAGVTNRSVSEDGQTLSETAEPDNPLIVYGGGSLSLQLAPWLQATAGVQFSPNGEVTVTGEIGLPDELEIFARREINKSIFNIAVQAPIFPGIVAEIGGGLSATAGIGPGVIDQLRLDVTYNPDHEEDTHITGDAHLNIPANAGLRLSVRAGIGLGITGASATGGLDIGGTLGIEGAAEAGVHVDWTPTTGLAIEAEVAVHAQPSFTFDIGGYVSVRALGFSVYDERWEFASYTFGSDYRFGIRLPIHYREGEPFDISLDDVKFEVPDIDTNQLLRGLVARIA